MPRAPTTISVGKDGGRAPTTISVPPLRGAVQHGSGVRRRNSKRTKKRKPRQSRPSRKHKSNVKKLIQKMLRG